MATAGAGGAPALVCAGDSGIRVGLMSATQPDCKQAAACQQQRARLGVIDQQFPVSRLVRSQNLDAGKVDLGKVGGLREGQPGVPRVPVSGAGIKVGIEDLPDCPIDIATLVSSLPLMASASRRLPDTRATNPCAVIAPSKLSVCQCPAGLPSATRSPRGPRP